VKSKVIPTLKITNKFEKKLLNLNDDKLERIQNLIIKRICKLESDTLDFYDYKKTIEKFRKEESFENN
tara:strand:+ start:416 stop:619 length:204 start_codon:yes stop_codon:yes gene_type:complete